MKNIYDRFFSYYNLIPSKKIGYAYTWPEGYMGIRKLSLCFSLSNVDIMKVENNISGSFSKLWETFILFLKLEGIKSITVCDRYTGDNDYWGGRGFSGCKGDDKRILYI